MKIIIRIIVMLLLVIPTTNVFAKESVVITNGNIASFNLTQNSELTLEEIELLLGKFPNLLPISNKLYECQNEYNVNVHFVIALIRNESANGESSLTKSNNNIIGAKVGGNYMKFETLDDCVDYLHRLLSEKYLNEDGVYFNGYTLSSVNKKYCGDQIWYDTISTIMVSDYNVIAEK